MLLWRSPYIIFIVFSSPCEYAIHTWYIHFFNTIYLFFLIFFCWDDLFMKNSRLARGRWAMPHEIVEICLKNSNTKNRCWDNSKNLVIPTTNFCGLYLNLANIIHKKIDGVYQQPRHARFLAGFKEPVWLVSKFGG